MRHRYTKERKREIDEFVYKYRFEIANMLAKYDGFPHSPEQTEFVKKIVLVEIGYSEKTAVTDIFHSIKKAFKRIFNLIT